MLKFIPFLLAALALGFSAPAYACDFEDSDGLDVALVLSGGGAKASTQVGVMKLLDEMDIPIHCVVGTSMGAVVGSFYSAGYSADEIGTIMTEHDWGEIFRGKAPRRDKSFIEKEREESYLSGNVAGLSKDGLSLPGGLNSMQGLKSLYRTILQDIPQDINFDDLELPFRAVAADLETGEAKAFARGDLVESILASMTVPGVFAPREVDGHFYVDGGIAATLPIKIAQDMGADIIIALDVSNAPIKPTADISVAAAVQQITTIVVWRNLQRDLKLLKKTDLLIQPNTTKLGTASYNRSVEGLAAGYSAAQQHRNALLAIKAKAAPSKRKTMSFVKPTDGPLIVANNTGLKDELIKARFEYNGVSGKIAQKLSKNSSKDGTKYQARRLRDLASFGGFGEVDLGHSNGQAVLSVKENPLGRNLLQVGLNATNDFDGNSTYSVLARMTRRPLSSRGGDMSVSAELGTNLGLSAEIYQPFGADGRFFIQPELFARWEQNKFNLIDARIGDFWVQNIGARARLGREIGEWGVIALEGSVVDSKTSAIVSIIEELEDSKTQQASLGLYFGVDTLNRNDWPTKGQRVRLRARRSYDLDNTQLISDRYEGSFLAAMEVAGLGVLLNARYGQIDDKNPAIGGTDFFRLGGFRQLAAFGDNSIPVNEYALGSVELFKRLSKTGAIFELPLYAGAIAELAVFPLDLFEVSEELTTVSGSLYLGADTAIGPAFIGAAYGNNDEFKVFFKFGRTF